MSGGVIGIFLQPETVPELVGFAVALGVGLLVGAERERSKGQGPARRAAGIRTFAISGLAGAVALQTGGAPAFVSAIAVVGALGAVSVWTGARSEDPGITTEFALVLTALLGGLAVRKPELAAMIGVLLAGLLAARTPLHRFVGSSLSEHELQDALVIAAATLIVLPLLPDRRFGPFLVLNLRTIWLLVILVLLIAAAGHVAVRLVGARRGLPLAGLLSGFVSSTATIGAMGAHAKAHPLDLPAASAGAVLSTLATMVQLAAVIAAVNAPTLDVAAPSLIAGGSIALAYGGLAMARALGRPAPSGSGGRAFSLPSALLFAATVSIVLLAAAACRAWFGEAGLLLAGAVAGIADAHAAAISMASIVAAGQAAPRDVLAPILVGVSTNTISKLVMAYVGGGPTFLARIAPGLILVVAAMWLIPAALGYL